MKLFAKRIGISVVLGIAFGFLCSYLASGGIEGVPKDPNFWGSVLMYQIVFNRFLIGFVIGLAGILTHCPFTGLRLHPLIRGAFLGALVSIDMAIGTFMTPNVDMEILKTLFFMTLGAGAVYGLIIDLVATKLAGEGKELVK